MYQQHPLSAAWPAMSEAEFQSLKESIGNIGVQMPIVIFEDQVIDGWNRYRAANDLGMDCPTTPFDTSIDPRDFVKAMNDARRHITGSQRAIAIVAIYKWHPAAVKGGGEATSPPLSRTNKEMSKEAGVSERSIQHAKAAQTAGLSEKVKSGELTVEQASNLAKGKPAKPAPKPAAATPEYFGPDEAEIRAAEMQEAADQEAFNKLLLADDKLATAYAEIKKLNALNAVLESRLQGLMNEKNEAIKLCKSLQRRLDRAEKVPA